MFLFKDKKGEKMNVSSPEERNNPDTTAVSAGSGDQEAFAHTQQPVQEIFGTADEDFKRLPAVLCSVHQAQWIQETHGECLHFGLTSTRNGL